MRDQILTVLQHALPHARLPADIGDDTEFAADLGLDSLDMLSFSTALEKAFSIRIEDVEWTSLQRVSDAVTLVSSRLPAAAGAGA